MCAVFRIVAAELVLAHSPEETTTTYETALASRLRWLLAVQLCVDVREIKKQNFISTSCNPRISSSVHRFGRTWLAIRHYSPAASEKQFALDSDLRVFCK